MKKLIILLIIPVFFGFKTGDEFDEKRMNRDLEIAKNILATLIKSGSDSWFGGTSIEASYIKDYGVVFSIPEHLVYFHNGGSVIAIPEIAPIPDVDIDFYADYDFSDEELSKAEFKKQKEIMKKKEKEFKKQEKEIQEQMQEMEEVREDMIKAREEAQLALVEEKELQRIYVGAGGDSEIDWEEIMITFMTDYSDLIGQLQPNEKIVIKQKSPYNNFVFAWAGDDSVESDEREIGSISAEVLRKDVSAYKSGKIKKNDFVGRIEIKKSEPQKKVADLEMFANIFDRFYSHDLTETFYSQGKPRYEVLDGFGAVFHIKTASANSRSIERVRWRSSGVEAYTIQPKSDEEKSTDEELYLKFKEDIKAFMLDYGRTIRSLGENEKVLLDIKINSCRECNIPTAIEVSTKMSVLKQYDQQKISRDKAMNQIEIKEND